MNEFDILPLAWVRDDDHVVVVAESLGRSITLTHAEACLWELWCDRESDATLHLAELWDLDSAEAETISLRLQARLNQLIAPPSEKDPP